MRLYIGIAGIAIVCLTALVIMHLPLDVEGEDKND